MSLTMWDRDSKKSSYDSKIYVVPRISQKHTRDSIENFVLTNLPLCLFETKRGRDVCDVGGVLSIYICCFGIIFVIICFHDYIV